MRRTCTGRSGPASGFDGGLVEEHHRDVVLDGVYAMALVALEARVAVHERHRLQGFRAHQDLEQRGIDRHRRLLGKLGSLYQTRSIVKQSQTRCMGPLLLVLAVVLADPPGAPAQAPPGPPDSAAYYQFLLGRHLESAGEPDKALAALREAARLAPAAADIRAEIASLLAREGREREALDEARAALAVDARNHEANRVLGALLAASMDEAGKSADERLLREA